MQLNKIQENFKDTLLDPDKLESTRAIYKAGGLSLENRMKVYRNNVIRSLSDPVIKVYAAVEKLVSEDFMRKMVREYVVKNLPEEGNLNLYGATFPDFLETFAPVNHLPYITDVARLEWAWEDSYYARDDKALSIQELQSIPQERLPSLSLTLRHSVHLIPSSYPLDQIMEFCRQDNTKDMTLNIDSGGVKLMVIRPELEVELRKLSDNEFTLLSALKKGKTIGEACETILADDPNFNLGAVLQAHFQLGTFSSFTMKD